MRKVALIAVAGLGLAGLAGCGGGKGGVFAGKGPDEFAVGRRAPLVIPPDFALTPPKPGAPRPQEADSSTQALQALFGGPAQRSAGEAGLIGDAGPASDAGIRSEAGDSATTTVNKGPVTRDILSAPTGAGQDASASTTAPAAQQPQ